MSTVLLVEDNALIERLVLRRLCRAGHTVNVARDGLAGVTMARESNPDIVLMDLGLPVIDGLEATRRLKADAATRHIPIIALTAHAMTAHRDEALLAGCDGYQSKPIDFTALREQMDRLLATNQNREITCAS